MDLLSPTQELADALDPYRAVDRSAPQGEAWVLGHMVAGIDGTAAVNGRVGALSAGPDQDLFRRMRELGDVVLVGAETVRLEGYGAIRLSAAAKQRRVDAGKPPTPPVAIVSRSLELDFSASVFADAPDYAPTLVVTGSDAPADRLTLAKEVGEVVVAGDAGVDPRRAVAALAERGHAVVVCEGGPTWLGQLAAANRLDELLLTISPVMGGDPLPVAVTPPGAGLSRFELRHVLAEEGNLFLRYEAVITGA
ncbi:dihydrofolate reductase family protein [Actinomycetota bacterium]